MEQNMRFGLVLGWLAVMKISDWAINYVTFEDTFLCFLGHRYNIILIIVVSTKNNFNKYKSEILFHKKSPEQDFIIKTLHGSISVVPLLVYPS